MSGNCTKRWEIWWSYISKYTPRDSIIVKWRPRGSLMLPSIQPQTLPLHKPPHRAHYSTANYYNTLDKAGKTPPVQSEDEKQKCKRRVGTWAWQKGLILKRNTELNQGVPNVCASTNHRACPRSQLYPLTLYPHTLLHLEGLPTAQCTLLLSNSSFMHPIPFYTHTKPISQV